MIEMLKKSTQLWKQILEDRSIHDMEGKEENFHAKMKYFKQCQRIMSLLEKIKTAIEMKNLHAKEKVV
jgi:hypothetical protein